MTSEALHSLALVALSGASAGAVHVVAGPDHIAAIGPLAVGARTRAMAVGASWGLGHASGVALVGAMAVLFITQRNIELLSAWSERAVGVMLIVLGGWGIWRTLGRARPHAHPAPRSRTALSFGLLHGVAGSAHVLGALPALLVPTLAGKLLYLGSFGAGSAATMTLVAQAIGYSGTRMDTRRAFLVLSASSVLIGLFWLSAAADAASPSG